MLPGPLHKGYLHAPDALQRLLREVALALALAFRVQAAFLIGPVQYVLQHSCVQIADAPGPDDRQNVVPAKVPDLIGVAGPARRPHRDHVFFPDL